MTKDTIIECKAAFAKALQLLLADEVLLGACLLQVEREWCETTKTASVDGRTLQINPVFWRGLSVPERAFILAHEAVHVALCHPARMPRETKKGTDPRAWHIEQVAADLAVNELLQLSGAWWIEETLTRWKARGHGVFVGQGRFADYPPHSSYETYRQLLRRDCTRTVRDAGTGESGHGTGSAGQRGHKTGKSATHQCGAENPSNQCEQGPSSQADGHTFGNIEMTGEFAHWPGKVDPRMAEIQNQTIVWRVAGTTGKLAGTSSAVRALVAARLSRGRPVVNWYDLLKQFVRSNAVYRRTFTRPRRRIPGGCNVLLPYRRTHGLRHIVFTVDVSGSMCGPCMDKAFDAVIEAARAANIDNHDTALTVITWDTQVLDVYESAVSQARALSQWITSPKPVGGGTVVAPVLRLVARKYADADVTVHVSDCYLYDNWPTQFPNPTAIVRVAESREDAARLADYACLPRRKSALLLEAYANE